MIKIKLHETKTLSVPEELVDRLTLLYRGAFIKLVIEYINKEIASTSSKQTNKYINLLEKIKKKYSKEFEISQTPGYYSDLSLENSLNKPTRIVAFSVEQLIKALVNWGGLDTYIRNKMQPEEFGERLRAYFKKRKNRDIQFDIKFGKREEDSKNDFAGLYDPVFEIITVTFNSSFFKQTVTRVKNQKKKIVSEPGLSVVAYDPKSIVDNVETEMSDTRTSVRHELQHLFQNLISLGLGIGGGNNTESWRVGLPPAHVLRSTKQSASDVGGVPHYMDPIEMQTDIQDEVDSFKELIDQFKEKLKNDPKMSQKNHGAYSRSLKILAKIFAHVGLTDTESAFAQEFKLRNYIFPNQLFGNIKSKNAELYKYALGVLFNSIGDEIRENIIMDKIKIVLTESTNLISENITKDEIKKIIRDELEKLLRDKEIKKEIGDITKKFMKKFYRELSISSTYVIDRIDV